MAIQIHKPFLVQFMLVLLLNAAPSQTLSYESVRLDESGQLRIKPVNGKEVLAPRLPHQSKFGAPAVSPDNMSVGWLAEFEDSSSPSPINPDAFTLVVCRNGRIFRLVSGDPIVWDWTFERGGKAVAYSTGSRHGGANECLLVDIDSGKFSKSGPLPQADSHHHGLNNSGVDSRSIVRTIGYPVIRKENSLLVHLSGTDAERAHLLDTERATLATPKVLSAKIPSYVRN